MEWQVILGSIMLGVVLLPLAMFFVCCFHELGKSTREWVHARDGPLDRLHSFFAARTSDLELPAPQRGGDRTNQAKDVEAVSEEGL